MSIKPFEAGGHMAIVGDKREIESDLGHTKMVIIPTHSQRARMCGAPGGPELKVTV